MNLKWTALAAMALLTPCAFAQQFGWKRIPEFSEFTVGWEDIDVYSNSNDYTLTELTYRRPFIPYVSPNKVWGSAYTGCPWTPKFATLFDNPYNVDWLIPDDVELYDEMSQTSSPAPNPLSLGPGMKITLYYRYHHSKGHETWVWVTPPRGIEVEGTPPDPMDEGPHRRDRDVKSQWEGRITITPMQ